MFSDIKYWSPSHSPSCQSKRPRAFWAVLIPSLLSNTEMSSRDASTLTSHSALASLSTTVPVMLTMSESNAENESPSAVVMLSNSTSGAESPNISPTTSKKTRVGSSFLWSLLS